MTMREPMVTDFLWYRLLLDEKHRNDSNLCNKTLNNSAIPDHLGDLRDQFLVWIYPVLLLIGLSGICATLLTLQKHPNVVPKTTRLWLEGLLVVDMLVLIVIGVRWWTYVIFQRDVAASQIFICVLYNYVIYCLVHLSGWIQAMLFIERIIVVTNPLHAKRILRPRNTFILMSVIVVSLLILNSPILIFTYNYTDSLHSYSINKRQLLFSLICQPSQTITFGLKLVSHIDLTVGSIIPLVIMLVGTVVITNALRTGQSLVPSQTNSILSKKRKKQKRRRKQRRVCIVLLCMNIIYLLTNYPFTIFLVITAYRTDIGPKISDMISHQYYLLYALLYLLSFVNNATNWALLTMTGHSYRNKFRRVVLPCFFAKRSTEKHNPGESAQNQAFRDRKLSTRSILK